MHSLLRLIAGLGFLVSTALAADLAPPDAKSASDYFLQLRLAYAKTPTFHASWISNPDRTALLKLYDEGKPADFIAKSTAWLKQCPVDAKVHMMLANLLLKSGDNDGGIFHRLMFYGLATSIVASGDGKTAKTAYKVIAVDEEYTILNYIGADLKRQSLQDNCDVMECTLDEKPVVIYFDVTIPLEVESKLLKAANAK